MRMLLFALNTLMGSTLAVLLCLALYDMRDASALGGGFNGDFLPGLVHAEQGAITLVASLSAILFIFLVLIYRYRNQVSTVFGDGRRFVVRTLIGLEVLLFVIGTVIACAECTFAAGCPSAANEVSYAMGYALAIAFLVLFVVSRIGVALMWRPARGLYLCSTLFLLLVTPLFGTSVDGPWTGLYETMSMMLSGFILCFIYLSPAHRAFGWPAEALEGRAADAGAEHFTIHKGESQ